MFVKWSFTSLLTKQTRSAFIGTAKRATRKLTCGYCKKRCKGNEEWLDCKLCDHPTSMYLFKVSNKNTRKRCEICSKLTIKTPERRQWLVLKSNQHLSRSFHYFVVKFSCLYKCVLLFTVQWKLLALIFSENYLPTFWLLRSLFLSPIKCVGWTLRSWFCLL